MLVSNIWIVRNACINNMDSKTCVYHVYGYQSRHVCITYSIWISIKTCVYQVYGYRHVYVRHYDTKIREITMKRF